MDWNSFGFEYRLGLDSRRLQNLLVQIERYREVAANLPLSANWKNRLDRLNRIRAVRGTTALEGNRLSEEQVAKAMEEEIGAQSAEVERRQAYNAGVAHEWVKSKVSPGRTLIATRYILYMHSLLTTGSDEENNTPGRIRTHEVTVGGHRGAPHGEVRGLMDAFVAFINSPQLKYEHPVVRALLAHFFLVTIHPFGDGNGRVSRLVEAAVLYEGGYNVHGFYGLSNFFCRQGEQYMTLLQRCRRRFPFDARPFVELGLVGAASELRDINSFIMTKLNRLVYQDMMTRALNTRIGKRRRILNRREFSLLNFLLKETEPEDPFSVEPSRLVPLAKVEFSPFVREVYRPVTRRTFVRELTRLSDNGFINFGFDAEADDYAVAVDFEAIGRY